MCIERLGSDITAYHAGSRTAVDVWIEEGHVTDSTVKHAEERRITPV